MSGQTARKRLGCIPAIGLAVIGLCLLSVIGTMLRGMGQGLGLLPTNTARPPATATLAPTSTPMPTPSATIEYCRRSAVLLWTMEVLPFFEEMQADAEVAANAGFSTGEFARLYRAAVDRQARFAQLATPPPCALEAHLTIAEVIRNFTEAFEAALDGDAAGAESRLERASELMIEFTDLLEGVASEISP